MDSKKKASIAIDMKYGKIRIHRNTVNALGRPEYISLIINPVDRTLGVKRSSAEDKEAHHLNMRFFEGRSCCRLNSLSLTRDISAICPEWKERQCVTLKGNLIPAENMVIFSLNTSNGTNDER